MMHTGLLRELLLAQLSVIFSEPRFANFSIQREYPIRFGTNTEGRADIGLVNSEGAPVTIVECKRIGNDDENDGIAQLKSYLNGSGTELGVFAEDTDPYEWTFFIRNRKQFRFDKITRSQFERELGVDSVPEMLPTRTRLEIIQGNIVESEVDAIVNAAKAESSTDKRESEIDTATFGMPVVRKIDRACQKIIENEGVSVLLGDAVITTGGEPSTAEVCHSHRRTYLWQGGGEI